MESSPQGQRQQILKAVEKIVFFPHGIETVKKKKKKTRQMYNETSSSDKR